ncbi:hypothetical protein MTO96_005300 [Rhipicephalus appendiculatus]
MSAGNRTCDPGTYSRKIFSALLHATASVEARHSMLHAAAAESHSLPGKSSDTALDIVVHYIKPLSCGGRESSVVVVDLARRFDVLALAQQIDEPHLQDSLSRLQIVHCQCLEALFCTVEKLMLSAVPIALLAVYAAPHASMAQPSSKHANGTPSRAGHCSRCQILCGATHCASSEQTFCM